jgi:hypothetical protein
LDLIEIVEKNLYTKVTIYITADVVEFQ